MAVPSSLVIFLSCINVTLYNFWARIKIVGVVVVIVVVVSLWMKWKCSHSNESYRKVLSCGAVIMLHRVVHTFASVDEIRK